MWRNFFSEKKIRYPQKNDLFGVVYDFLGHRPKSWFLDEKDARCICEASRKDYNEARPHSSIRQLTAIEFASTTGQASLTSGWKAHFSHCP
jgi:transposase InsO family protein